MNVEEVEFFYIDKQLKTQVKIDASGKIKKHIVLIRWSEFRLQKLGRLSFLLSYSDLRMLIIIHINKQIENSSCR